LIIARNIEKRFDVNLKCMQGCFFSVLDKTDPSICHGAVVEVVAILIVHLFLIMYSSGTRMEDYTNVVFPSITQFV
jgi:hypothetical protein